MSAASRAGAQGLPFACTVAPLAALAFCSSLFTSPERDDRALCFISLHGIDVEKWKFCLCPLTGFLRFEWMFTGVTDASQADDRRGAGPCSALLHQLALDSPAHRWFVPRPYASQWPGSGTWRLPLSSGSQCCSCRGSPLPEPWMRPRSESARLLSARCHRGPAFCRRCCAWPGDIPDRSGPPGLRLRLAHHSQIHTTESCMSA